MMMHSLLVVFAAVSVATALPFASAACNPVLQNTTYRSHLEPLPFADVAYDATPFFSPDTSAMVLAQLITTATSTVDIATPYFTSWIGCSQDGCTVEQLRTNETFPLWSALVTAAHRGVAVRVLTMPCANTPQPGRVDPLTFLHYTDHATVRYFTQTSHLHDKVIIVDGWTTSISSVNFSPNSFMHNREAGIVFRPSSTAETGSENPIAGFANALFADDWGTAVPFTPLSALPQSQIDAIRAGGVLLQAVASGGNYTCGYTTHAETHAVKLASGVIYASPDESYDTLMDALATVQSSFLISIYEISHPVLCQELIGMSQHGVDVRVLVSDQVYGEGFVERSEKCYSALVGAGMVVRKTRAHCYTYSHQKYWIADNATLSVSTGNWDMMDFPQAHAFPPPPIPPTLDELICRDVTVTLDEPAGVLKDAFLDVFEQDWATGHDYTPKE